MRVCVFGVGRSADSLSGGTGPGREGHISGWYDKRKVGPVWRHSARKSALQIQSHQRVVKP